jgi:DNA-binding transcriptional ArsR family regulator
MKIDQAKAKAEILRALANPVRLVVVDALRRGDLCVSDLNKLVGVRQPTLSRHLIQLKKVGIVTERREGPRVIHHLETPCILKAVDCASHVMTSHLTRQKNAV